MCARHAIRRIAVVAGIVAVMAGMAVVPGAARPAASAFTPTTCTADEQAGPGRAAYVRAIDAGETTPFLP